MTAAQSASDVVAEKIPVFASTGDIPVRSSSDRQTEVRYERKMGNSEISYYLPSRANGVNDM